MLRQTIKVSVIDTFISERCTGNPTAVSVTNIPLSHEQALALAKEFNLPVTAFIEFPQKDNTILPIRYFTPLKEIPACGHATLATVKVVADLFSFSNPSFRTKEGIVIETRIRDGIVTMNYPKYELKSCSVPEPLLQSLQVREYKSAGICDELEALFIELEDPVALKTIQPDFAKLSASIDSITEVVITSLSRDDNYDFILRSFCPWIGIDEDPATGSVHSVLASFWERRLNKNHMKAWQASERGGVAFVTSLPEHVQIGGRVRTASVKELSIN